MHEQYFSMILQTLQYDGPEVKSKAAYIDLTDRFPNKYSQRNTYNFVYMITIQMRLSSNHLKLDNQKK